MTPVLAVAANLVKDLLRRRSTYALAALLVLSGSLLPGAGADATGAREQLRLAVAYGMGLPAFLVALFTIVTSSGLAREIESRRQQLLATKPIPAWKVIAGRLLGVLAADAALLLLLLATLGFNVARIASSTGDPADFRLAQGRFFTPRGEVAPALPPLDKSAVKALVESLGREARAGHSTGSASLDARARVLLRSLRLAPGESGELAFPGLGRGAGAGGDEILPVRFVAHSLVPSEAARVTIEWLVLEPDGRGWRSIGVQEAPHGVPAEVLVPATAVPVDGSLRLRVRNASDPKSGVSLLLDPARARALPRRGSFAGSLVAVSWLLLVQWALLAALGSCFGAFFRFPTAVLAGVFLHVTALASGFLRETFELFEDEPARGGLSERFAAWASQFGGAVLNVLPDFSTLDPLDRLGAGRSFEILELARETAVLLGLEALVAVAIGAIILGRRELGR